jgi:hypothetical protein
VRAITVIAEAARAMAVHATTASTQEAATTRERAAASIEDVEARATLAERGGGSGRVPPWWLLLA